MRKRSQTSTNAILIWVFILFIVTSCSTKSNPGSSPPSGGSSSGNEGQSPAEPTATIPPPTPTVERTAGKGKLHVDRLYSSVGSGGDNLGHKVLGVVPFTIQYNESNQVYEAKGSSICTGHTEFSSEIAQCRASWNVDVVISGTLIPSGGLIAEGDEGGCYLQLYISEFWEEMYDVECSLEMLQPMVSLAPEGHFGTYKFNLINGDSNGEIGTEGAASWNYIWRVNELVIPLETGCVAGE